MPISRKLTRMVSAMADADHPQTSEQKPAASGPGAETRASEPEADPGPLAVLQAELADTKDKLLRALAEQQNIRQQMQRQREEAVKFAASQLTGDLLETLDNLRRAIESVPQDTSDHGVVNPILKGVEVTEANLLATLSRHGLQRIDPLGKVFDPHFHHAIRQHPEATASKGTVVEVLQPGYMLHGRVLRPAMVGVAVNGQQDGGIATP